MSTNLDFGQVIKKSFDDANDALKVNVVQMSGGGDASAANQVLIIDELEELNGKVFAVDTGNVVVVSSALPTGAATESTLIDIETAVASLDSKTIGVDTSDVTITSSVLPNGAATEAKQDNIISSIDTLSGKTAGALVPEKYDYILQTYVGATTDLATVVYKLGGSGGTTVATLTMGYDGSNRLSTITKT